MVRFKVAKVIVPTAIARERLEEQLQKGRALAHVNPGLPAMLDMLMGSKSKWEVDTLYLLGELSGKTVVILPKGSGDTFKPRSSDFREHVRCYKDNMAVEVDDLEKILAQLDAEPAPARAAAPRVGARTARKVFVAHGHDMAVPVQVARLVEQLGLESVLFEEHAYAGRTNIEKIEDLSDVAFAVVVMTPDDMGATQGEADNLKPRARQNVIFELGYFAGRLGRGKTCAVYDKSVEMPSNYDGVGYVRIDAEGSWRVSLAVEMKAVGLDIDLNKLAD